MKIKSINLVVLEFFVLLNKYEINKYIESILAHQRKNSNF